MNDIPFLIGRDSHACYTQINNDEIVVLNFVDENFYHLNESAVDLWLSLETPKTVLELAQVLTEKYVGHSLEACQQDVMEWIEDTRQKGLLAIMDAVD